MKILFSLVPLLSVFAIADGFECKNQFTGPTPRWSVKSYNSRTAGEGRVPASFYLSNGKRGGTIVRVEDRRRLLLDGKNEGGVEVSVRLNDAEVETLLEKADARLSKETLDEVTVVSLWINYEQNENLLSVYEKNGDLTRRGYLTLSNRKNEELYSYRLNCDYNPVERSSEE